MLLDLGVNFTRYVDDYRIIATPQRNTHTILCRLAEHLMVTEGLSLNVSKTKIVNTERVRSSAEARLEDVFSSSEMRGLREYLSSAYGDEETDTGHEDENPRPAQPFLTGENLLDRLDELERHAGSDFSSQKAVLKVLRTCPAFDAARLIIDHPRLAYYLPRDFCRALHGWSGEGRLDKRKVAEEVILLLKSPPVSELSYAKAWLMNLFVNGTLEPDRRIVTEFPARLTPLEERQQIFVRALLHDRSYFRENKGKLGSAGEWIKPAILMGASCLPGDEYATWVDLAVRQLAGPFTVGFGRWLKRRLPLDQLLSP